MCCYDGDFNAAIKSVHSTCQKNRHLIGKDEALHWIFMSFWYYWTPMFFCQSVSQQNKHNFYFFSYLLFFMGYPLQRLLLYCMHQAHFSLIHSKPATMQMKPGLNLNFFFYSLTIAKHYSFTVCVKA